MNQIHEIPQEKVKILSATRNSYKLKPWNYIGYGYCIGSSLHYRLILFYVHQFTQVSESSFHNFWLRIWILFDFNSVWLKTEVEKYARKSDIWKDLPCNEIKFLTWWLCISENKTLKYSYFLLLSRLMHWFSCLLGPVYYARWMLLLTFLRTLKELSTSWRTIKIIPSCLSLMWSFLFEQQWVVLGITRNNMYVIINE